jgi:hypothetical protein
MAMFLHTALLKRTVSLSPLEGSAQFSKNNFRSKEFVPEATGYSKSCNQIQRSRIRVVILGKIRVVILGKILVVVLWVRHHVAW